MRKLRYVALILGVALLLLMFRGFRAKAIMEMVALAPAAITGTVLLIANLQEAHSRDRRRLVAVCWAAAAVGSAISCILAFGGGAAAIGTVTGVLAIGQVFAAVFAVRRSKFYRLKFYNNYLDD